MKTRARVNVYELSSYSSCYYVNVSCAYGFELRNRFKQWCSNIIMTTTMMIRCNAAKSKISLSRSFARFAIFQQIDCVLGVCNASAEQRVHTHNDAWQIILQILPHFLSFFLCTLFQRTEQIPFDIIMCTHRLPYHFQAFILEKRSFSHSSTKSTIYQTH